MRKSQTLTIEGQTKLVIFGRNKLKYRVGLKQTLLCETLVNIEGKQTNKSKNTETYPWFENTFKKLLSKTFNFTVKILIETCKHF